MESGRGSCVVVGTLDRTGLARNALLAAGIEVQALHSGVPRIGVLTFCRNQPALRVVAVFSRAFEDRGAALVEYLRQKLPPAVAIHALVEEMPEEGARSAVQSALKSAGAGRVSFSSDFKNDTLVQLISFWYKKRSTIDIPVFAPAPAVIPAKAPAYAAPETPAERQSVQSITHTRKEPNKAAAETGRRIVPRETHTTVNGCPARIVRLLTCGQREK